MAKEKKEKKLGDETLAEQPRAEAAPTEQTTFKSKVNAYCFIHLPKKLRKAWGVSKGTEQPIAIELTAEGNLIIRKA